MTTSTEALPPVDADGVWAKQSRVSLTGYVLIHLACLLTLFTGVSTTDLVLCFSMVFVRMFGITGGYHRYFAHRSYRTSRAFQFVLALIGCSSLQKGPLWWAGGHRRHHRYSDEPGDMHSPKRGLWYAHQLWIFDPQWGPTEIDRIRDFARYPELVWMNQWHLVPTFATAVLCYAIGGFSGLIWGFFVGTVVLLHLTYSINSLAHVWGSRRYETADTSRNNWLLAILTLGEGWHNNHHHYMTSTRQGFFWWEIDVTYYILRGLAALGLIWDLREPPAEVIRSA